MSDPNADDIKDTMSFYDTMYGRTSEDPGEVNRINMDKPINMRDVWPDDMKINPLSPNLMDDDDDGE